MEEPHFQPNNMSKKIMLYHYTDERGATGIANSAGIFEGSPKQNRGYVYGIYFTSSDPSNDPETILLNTYDYTGRVINTKRLWEKIDYVIEVDMDKNEVEKVSGVSNGDVYLYKGDVDLYSYEYFTYRNPIKTLYHYTDATGAAGIKEGKVIRKSTYETPIQNRRHGYGVYFTSIEPSNDPKEIFLDNYDDRGFVVKSQRLWAKIDWVIEVKMDMNKVEKVYESNRDVHLYKGDVDLNNYQCSIHKNPFKTPYHYTDEAGADGIKNSKVIKGSTLETPIQNRRHGCGVNFTSIDPSNDQRKILLNNYDDRGFVVNSKRLRAKIDWVIEINMNENEVEKVSGVSNRDVYLYEGDVDLNNYQYSIYKNPNT